jgi:hypothetical protein
VYDQEKVDFTTLFKFPRVHLFFILSPEQPIEDDDSNVMFDAMRKEVRQTVEEIRTQLEKVILTC